MTTDETFGWDSALPENTKPAVEILPAGDAEFEVMKLDRQRKEMGRLGTCNVAVMKLQVTSLVENVQPQMIEVNLPLSPVTAYRLYQFFASIGHYKHGEVESGKPFKPDWSKVVGSTGLCVVKHREWTGKDGKTRVSADIDAYLDEKGRTRESDSPRAVGDPSRASKPSASEKYDQIPF